MLNGNAVGIGGNELWVGGERKNVMYEEIGTQ